MRFLRLIPSAAFLFVAIVALDVRHSAAFPERSQPAGGGFRNDSRGAGGSSTNGSRVDQLIAESNRAYYLKKYDESLEIINAVFGLQLTPAERAHALTIRGINKGVLEQNEGALKDFDEAIRYKPDLSNAYSNRARIYMKMDRYTDAMTDVNRAIALSPKNGEAYHYRSRLYSEQHRWDEALADATKAVTIYPKDGYFRADRAALEVRMGRINDALADANSAIALEKNAAEAYVARAHVYIHRKQYDEAEKDLQACIRIHSGYPAAPLNAIAWIRATCPVDRLRNGKEAVAMAKRACAFVHWKGAGCIDTLAAAYAESGDFDSAIKYETEALNSTRSSPPALVREYEQRLALFQKHQPYRDAYGG